LIAYDPYHPDQADFNEVPDEDRHILLILTLSILPTFLSFLTPICGGFEILIFATALFGLQFARSAS
jgi:hypothetical protein